ncbi:S-adenosyl-L-methionine-dependent methyltransferase [Helicostylum pulchrum]|uniref:Methyltransferase domain-containing protein n=1 Tax=Helicostylum pulchrum TaxID=562976 RepID=A0ABP9YD06_9FUNG|nr:S-adenosyl-L-methionine-dependent methyltransferase [Helicostylum pulchrum]
MGNQASKVLAISNKKKTHSKTKQQRRSSSFIVSQGNYDWLDQDPHSNENMALDAAVSAAVALQQQKKQNTALSQSVPASGTPAMNNTRRKSISEFFARRKQSLVSLHPTIVEEDMKEFDRLQRQHYLLKSTRKSNTWAPIESPKFIVEAGTGNGIWALEMANQYTESQVLGIDLKPPVFQHGNPTNLRYNQTNLNESWPMNDNSVDFIFQRNMYLHIQKDQWPKILEEMFRVLKPGGYIELIESDLWHHNPGPVQQAFQQFFKDQCKLLDLDLEISNSLAGTIEEKGFLDVEKRILDIPIGEWPTEPELKQYGFINKEIQKALLKNKKSTYVPKWGISPADYDLAVSEVLEEYEEFKSFSRFNCWIARKPTNEIL